MNCLVDYGSSSSGDSEEESLPPEEQKTKLPMKLPKPTLESNSLQTSVFSNKFVEAEQAKAAILEKHVKMVPGKDNTQMINGKKICWSHRRGRCRFGHNCKFAHDTDIQKTENKLALEKQDFSQVAYESQSTVTSSPPRIQEISATDDTLWEGGSDNRNKRRRPGLSQNLVPNKKVLQMYYDQKKQNNTH